MKDIYIALLTFGLPLVGTALFFLRARPTGWKPRRFAVIEELGLRKDRLLEIASESERKYTRFNTPQLDVPFGDTLSRGSGLISREGFHVRAPRLKGGELDG